MDTDRKPCNRPTCGNRTKCAQLNKDAKRSQMPMSRSGAEPVAATPNVGNSTQILFVDSNFTETPSEYDTFYDCYSDVEISQPSAVMSSMCGLSVPPSPVKDSRMFRDALKKVILTAQTLLVEFDSGGRKERRRCGSRCRCDVRNIKPQTQTVQLEVTAKVTSNKSSTPQNIRIDPITFTIPLKVHVQGQRQYNIPYAASQQSNELRKPPAMLERDPIPNMFSSIEPIRTAIITAPRQEISCTAEKCSQTDTHRDNAHLSGAQTIHLRIEPHAQNAAMSCINYPSNYRVIMETPVSTISNHPAPAEQPLTPVQCSCQRSFHQQNQHRQSPYPPQQPPQPPQPSQHPLHATQHQQIQQLQQQLKPSLQQQQQQQKELYQQQQQQLQNFVNCLNQQPLEQASASKSSQQDSQNSQASTVTTASLFSKSYCIRSTSESGGQLSCRCPFEISISSAHPPARPSYEIRLPSGMASSNYTGKNNLSEEEFFSLSSASSDRDDCIPSAAAKGKGKSVGKTKNRFLDCECSPSAQENKAKVNTNRPRNVAILQLLREVVQLINQGDENGTGCGCGVPTTKMRNIGALGSEESMADNGPFNSGFKITFTPSRKGTSPNSSIAHSDMSEPQPVGLPVNIPLQLPCNLIITPNLLTCAPCSPCVPSSNVPTTSPQKMEITTLSEGPTKSAKKVKVGEKHTEGCCSSKGMPCSCIGDLELIEEIATLALAADPKNRTEPSSQPYEEDSRYDAGTTFNAIVCAKGCPEECTCKQPCLCPVHGIYQPTAIFGQGSQAADDEECECVDGDDTGIVTEPSQSQTHISVAPSATASQRTNQTNKTKSDCTECSCCHCQAMRDKQNCSTIATQNQAKDQCSCSELRFFIDSIIMDLDAMEKARRKKNVEQNTTPTRARICPRQSFPVTITEVSDLGISSLYVKWVIHDCCGIGGYEIYVDGYLTNRYFHCNHEAAVICDVDVTKSHKIVLVAQPKQDCSCGDNMENKCKELMRKGDADKMDKTIVPPSSLWVPSIYLYDPCDKREGTPINRTSL